LPRYFYAGSLIPTQVIDSVRESAEAIYDTAEMNLDETTAVIEKAAKEGKDVARLQCGDPALYGADWRANTSHRSVRYRLRSDSRC